MKPRAPKTIIGATHIGIIACKYKRSPSGDALLIVVDDAHGETHVIGIPRADFSNIRAVINIAESLWQQGNQPDFADVIAAITKGKVVGIPTGDNITKN